MNYSEYLSYDALGLAELIRTKQITSSELLEITIELTEKIDPIINAIPIKHYDLAREHAKNSKDNGLFFGVPFLLKDLNNNLEGTITSGGSRVLDNIKADHTSELVKRTINSGLNIFGKTKSFLKLKKILFSLFLIFNKYQKIAENNIKARFKCIANL